MTAPVSQWVVRAGVANWQDLKRAYGYDRRAKVYGFSVQYAPGVSWQDLARAGNFPHPMICYADRTDLEIAIAALGYVLSLVSAAGRGYHHELTLSLLKDGTIVTDLPDDAAKALSAVFQQHKIPKP
jgi:hypothetical protein